MAHAKYDRNEMVRLYEQGMTYADIARKMGAAKSTVQRTLTLSPPEGIRRSRTVQQLELDRITQTAYGLAVAAQEAAEHLELPTDQNRHEVERWLADLNKALRSVKALRTQLRETIA